MKRFWTGMVSLSLEGFGRPRCCGAGWEAVLGEPPSSGTLFFESRGLFLLARRWETAQRALEKIWIAHHVLGTGMLDIYQFPHVTDECGAILPEMECLPGCGPARGDPTTLGTTSVVHAALVAARASRHRDLDYALALLGLSQGLAAMHGMDLEPSHWHHGPAVSSFPFDHVRLAYAIIAAYSVLEQLGLEIRVPDKGRSRKGGQWNTDVRRDLEARLMARGIDLTDDALWTARGTPRKIDRTRPTQPTGTAPWASGRIHDHEVALVDAIADLSWLRSKVASHRLGEDAQSLTLYDVANAHYVARRVFLHAIGWHPTQGMLRRRSLEQR